MSTREVGSLRTRLSWEDDGSTRSLKGFREDLKGLKSEMGAARTGSREYTQSLKGLRDQSDILNRTMKTQREQVSELRRRYEESRRAKGEDADTTKRLSTEYNKAVAEMNKTERQLERVTTEINNQINPWKKLSESAQAAGDKMQTVGRGISDFGQSYSLRVTAPIVASGVAVFKLASDFESAFAGVEKTFSGTDEQLADLRQGIRDMAKEIPASTTEISKVAEAAGQLGIKAENIEDFTRTMIDLGEATNLTSDQAATEFARFANIVGMSQDDFDRLGSSVVALGNSMATTEAEISTMAMRLAAQGSQVGMTEAQIMALAATMSSLGIEAEAGGTAMTTVLKKIQGAVDEGGASLETFASAAGVSAETFKEAWEKDAIVGLDMLIKGLSESSGEGENLTTILEDLGITGVREADTMLRLAGASDLLTDAVKTSSTAWEENTALSKEAETRYATTESQLKILMNRIKDIGITLGEALIPAVMDAIDAAEPFIKKIEEGAQAFSDMSEEEQQTILKMVALVAAVGPASIVLGNLTTAVGGVLKVGGSLVGVLGKAGGAGLIGRLGLLGLSGPVGLAVAGVGALAGGVYLLSQAMEDNLEDTVKSIQSRREELEANEDLVSSFERLQDKNRLTTDEMLRYMDVMTELKDAKTEEGIQKLREEQEKLLEKSGLTNEEMEEFLGLNEKILEKAPETSKVISDQGNAYAAVLDELKELNNLERERLLGDTYTALTAEMGNQVKNLERQTELQEEIKELEGNRTESLQSINDINGQIRDKDIEIAAIWKELATATDEEAVKLNDRLFQLEGEKDLLENKSWRYKESVDYLDKEISKKEKSLEETMKELGAFDELKHEYESIVLYQAGLTAEKGKGIEKLKEEQSNIDTARKKLEDFRRTGEATTDEYNEQNQRLNEQQRKIDEARKKLEDVNTVAGRTIYKDVNIRSNPSIVDFESGLGRTISKRVQIAIGDVYGPRITAYAEGTDYHPGGKFLAGEEGFELGRMGNRWEMLNLGMYNRPAGYEVFTHDESKQIISALNRMPAYATGARADGEAARVINQLNNRNDRPQTVQPVTNIYVSGNIDSELYDRITEKQARDTKSSMYLTGERGL